MGKWDMYKDNISFDIGDITKLSCDAIVNAANKSLMGGGGVDGAIHRAAGRELLEECRTLNGCETGGAKLTKGYKLPSKYVIHTVGPVYSGREEDAEKMRNCFINSLDVARQNDIHSIAFPAISTGAYRYPIEEALTIALESAMEWIEHNPDYEIKVFFSCFSQKIYDQYQRIIRNKLSV